MNTYEDIININYYGSKVYPKMSLYNRSAQFAPFAALTGFDWAIKETARLTTDRIEIDEGLKSIINNELLRIKKEVKQMPLIKVTYFIKDKYKKGGKYVTITDNVKKIDIYNSIIVMVNKLKIKIDDVISLKKF